MSSHDSHDTHKAHGHDQQNHGPHHVTSSATFLKILIVLLILTAITVITSRFDFGSANLLIAMLIAAVKATLVISIFMHLRWDTPINKIAFLCSFLFLSLLFLFTLADQATRSMDGANERTRAPVDKEWQHPSTLEKPQ
ncbi:hypothetical protein LBMAG49_11130 [Planctomycetota bacterium]|jgi:cytochrome c oxidase subunit 4|nr:hypothetical protein LBMAG49_11130 [Planctomycetota bacterium]